MKTMGISKFKSHALKILDQVAKTQEIIVITKRGKPLAQITPFRNSEISPKPGKLSDVETPLKKLTKPTGQKVYRQTV